MVMANGVCTMHIVHLLIIYKYIAFDITDNSIFIMNMRELTMVDYLSVYTNHRIGDRGLYIICMYYNYNTQHNLPNLNSNNTLCLCKYYNRVLLVLAPQHVCA
jgi:hypothetical protein